MSLINEALKKAQKLRHEDSTGMAASVPGSGTLVAKRGEPRSVQQIVLMAAGGIVLIVLSVVATFWFANRVPETKPALKPVVFKPADSSTPSPAIVAPAIKPLVVATEVPPAKPPSPPTNVEQPAPVATPAPLLAPTSQSLAKIAETPASLNSAPAMAPPAQAAASIVTVPPPSEIPPAPPPVAAIPAVATTTPATITTDPRIHAFVDAVKVMGIRSSSNGDSRVLMNDRVYRVNDIVDRNLGVRLTKVEPSVLTFTDSTGAIYTKNF